MARDVSASAISSSRNSARIPHTTPVRFAPYNFEKPCQNSPTCPPGRYWSARLLFPHESSTSTKKATALADAAVRVAEQDTTVIIRDRHDQRNSTCIGLVLFANRGIKSMTNHLFCRRQVSGPNCWGCICYRLNRIDTRREHSNAHLGASPTRLRFGGTNNRNVACFQGANGLPVLFSCRSDCRINARSTRELIPGHTPRVFHSFS
jgi:hypothetical protein